MEGVLSKGQDGSWSLNGRELRVADSLEILIGYLWHRGWIDFNGEEFILIHEKTNKAVPLVQGMRARFNP